MTEEVHELKNIFNDFKILAAKVNNDNKNKKKKLDETKELLEICKKEYEKEETESERSDEENEEEEKIEEESDIDKVITQKKKNK